MLFLDIKLARHGACSALVASDGLRGYNIIKTVIPDRGKIVCSEKDFAGKEAEAVFPTMVDLKTASERYIFI
jgi:hypothetical protein